MAEEIIGVVFDEPQINAGESFTRMNSFYIRFDLVGNIGQKPKFIERLSFLDFIQVTKVPFHEISLQYISGMNLLMNCSINLSDEFGFSFSTHYQKIVHLKLVIGCQILNFGLE